MSLREVNRAARTNESYFALRRALKRACADRMKAPAEPTRARTTVGFSGEFTQPFCALAERATVKSRATRQNGRNDFFIDNPQLENIVLIFGCQLLDLSVVGDNQDDLTI